MPDTVRVIISDEPPGSEFADTVPVERVKPCPLTVATSTSSLYVMVMVSAESTEAAVIRGGGVTSGGEVNVVCNCSCYKAGKGVWEESKWSCYACTRIPYC